MINIFVFYYRTRGHALARLKIRASNLLGSIEHSGTKSVGNNRNLLCHSYFVMPGTDLKPLFCNCQEKRLHGTQLLEASAKRENVLLVDTRVPHIQIQVNRGHLGSRYIYIYTYIYMHR